MARCLPRKRGQYRLRATREVGTLRARLQIALAALLFSTGGAAIKLSVLSSWQIASLRSGFAALALVLALPAWRRAVRLRALPVAVAYAATLVLFVTANTLTTAANSIFLQHSALLWVLVLAPWLLGERNHAGDLAIVAVLALGAVLIFTGVDPAFATAPDPERGDRVAAAAGVTWALAVLGLRWLGDPARGGDPDAIGGAVVLGNVLAFAACLPFALPLALPTGAPGPLDWAVVAYLGVFQIGLAYVLLARGIPELRALEISLILMIEPVLNALWTWGVHGERPGALSAIGALLILLGVLASALRRDAPT